MDRIYSLSIVDEGVLQQQYAFPNLIGLFVYAYSHINSYAKEAGNDCRLVNGDCVYSDDGYSNIHELKLNGQQSEFLWNYNFDGDEKLTVTIQSELVKLVLQNEPLSKFSLQEFGRLVRQERALKDTFEIIKQIFEGTPDAYTNGLQVLYFGFFANGECKVEQLLKK